MDWETLKADCLACSRCELCKTRTNVVFGQGVPDAEVLFVGEGPGQSEDEQGLPFVGRSGQLLDKYLFAIDLDREKNCYIANIVKCRPIRSDFSVTKEHGQFIEKNGILFMGTFHPAALLRGPQNKPNAFADFVALRDKIHEVCEHTYE